jgi:hypothetical protein
MPVTTPDQRAMLYFSNGVERLVIETSFVSAGTNFAWVVPLPSPPKIEAVSTNFFSYLNMAFQPHLVQHADPWWILFLLAGYFVGTGIWIFRKGGRWRVVEWIGLNLLLLFLLALLLPAFATARGLASSPSINGVNILERQSVGIYDTITLTGTNGVALLDWLNANSFATPKTALPAISSYAASGWVFVVGTINREAPEITGSRPHPLCFTFKTDKAVYPLRLTGIENPHCTIDLFVFGPKKAEAPGFHVDYCGKPSLIQTNENEDWSMHRELFGPSWAGDFKFGNPEILRMAFPATVATRLTGTLTSEQMQSDAWINWSPFESIVPTYHTQSAALGETFNWLAGVSLPALLLIQLLSPHLQRKLIIRSCLTVLLLASLCGFIRYHTIKTVEVTYVRGGWILAMHKFRELEVCVAILASEHTNSIPLTESVFLSELNEIYQRPAKNTFNDQPLRCEPTPGNITLQASTTTNGMDVFWHDIQSVPHKLATLPAH